jgi:hypothetical protein
VLGEVHLAAPERCLTAVARAGQQRLIDQLVVLEEADKDACEHPCHGRLNDLPLAPLLQRHRGSVGRHGTPMLHAQMRRELGLVSDMAADVILQRSHERLQVRKQCSSIDHAACPPSARTARWRFASQASGMRAISLSPITGRATPSTTGRLVC